MPIYLVKAKVESLFRLNRKFEDDLVNFLNSHNVPFSKLGSITHGDIFVDEEEFGHIEDWKTIHENRLEEILEEESLVASA